MNRRHRLALGSLLCVIALASGACEEEKPVERAEPAVGVNVQALLTCTPVAFTTCTSTATSFTCAIPAGAQTNDVLIAHYAGTGGTAPSAATGGTSWGLALVGSTATSNSISTAVFAKTWAAADTSTSPTFTGTSSSSSKYVAIGLWRGCGVPLLATAGSTVTSGTVTAANATLVSAGQTVVNYFSEFSSNSRSWNAQGAGFTNAYSPSAQTGVNIAMSWRNDATGTVNGDARMVSGTYTGARAITVVVPSGGALSGGPGAICTAGTDCASTFCVDGRCCNTACGAGSTTDCQACSVAAGAATNGTCGNLVGGTLCRATTDVCDAAESCTGTSSACPANGFLVASTTCRGTAGECDLAENCTGTTAACPSDSKKANLTACSDEGNPCTLDRCDGSSVTCTHPVGNSGATCRATAGACDLVETCTGTSTTCPTDVFRSAATSCRGTAGECDLAESCTGTTAACPSDAKKANATACTADANLCSLDQCNGTADACQHPAGNSGTICNATTGFCDLAETCTGTSTTCPANAYKANSTVCRATAGVCDAIEYCTGTTDSCPATDAKQTSGTACTADADPCTVDQCNGTTDSCQHPAGNAGATCRGTSGACDAAELCTGTVAGCPADVLAASGVLCRATAGLCDLQETCTGTSIACPSDTVRPNTFTCRSLNGACDVVAENCNGTTSACPADTYRPSTYTCNASTGVCDPAELCTGSANACPSNVFSSSATVCRGTTGACDAAETCTGSTAACPTDVLASSSTPCRFQSNVCDAVELCTGTSTSCPTDAYAPAGTDCGYTTGATTIYSTGTPTNSALRNAGYSAASVTNAGPNSTWADAIRYATTLPSTGADQYLYQQISTTGRKFQAYDMVEYDVYLADSQSKIGGLDVENGGTALRGSGISDQNSLSCNPTTNLASNAFGAWYHRRYALGGTGMVNTTSTSWTIADENDTAHAAYTAYYDNIIVAATAGACTGANVCKIKTSYGCTANSDCAGNVCNSTTLDASNTHRWNLDTNANAAVGGQNGSTHGSVSWSGGGAVLTGTTSGPYISVPTAVMSGLTDVTFEAWFSIDTHVTGQRIFDFGSDTTEYIYLTDRFDGTNIPRVGYKRNGGTEIRFSASTSFATTTLTHIAVSVDATSSMTLYINGTNAGSVALGGSDTLSAITFDQNYLGASQSSSDPELDGRIYDFRVYNKALSAAEVLATYRKGVDSKVCGGVGANGTSCATTTDCSSGFCVDSRCCSTACDAGDTTNCEGCSVAVGAAANGTCGALANGTECRASVDPSCDFAEDCDGASTACPANDQ